MKSQATQPTGIDQNFAINETFFSTTDSKGIITSGNSIFARTSEYTIEELIGSAHNLIRHRDMPRCVFKLLWQFAKANRPFAGYVKNHAKNGNHYWVFAMIEPTGDQLLSIRIKPSCGLLEKVESLYRALLEIEEQALASDSNNNEAIAQSTARLELELKTLGFDSYPQFSQHCLNLEIKSRDKLAAQYGLSIVPGQINERAQSEEIETFNNALKSYQSLGKTFSNLDRFLDIANEIANSRTDLAQSANHFRHYALNTNIAAVPLGALGMTISTITDFLHSHAESFTRDAKLMAITAEHASHEVAETAARLASARIQLEMLLNFTDERSSNADSLAQQRLHGMTHSLQKAIRSTLANTISHTESIRKHLPSLRQKKEQLLKAIISFNAAQTSGLIECSRIKEARGLSQMFKDFGQRIERSKALLDHSASIIEKLQELTKTLPETLSNALGDLKLEAALRPTETLKETQQNRTGLMPRALKVPAEQPHTEPLNCSSPPEPFAFQRL